MKLENVSFFDICLHVILFFFTIASKVIVIVITYVPFAIICLIEHFGTYFPQLFLNNIKNQLNKIHIGVDKHRDIYLSRVHVKNSTKRPNEKATTVTYSTYRHVFHILM